MKRITSVLTSLLVFGGSALASPFESHRLVKHATNTSLPIVDLGYTVQQATLNDSSFPYYNFSNVRYAQPPLGDLRFRAPLTPNGTNTTVNDGQTGVICPQANPAWELIAELFLAGVPLDEITAIVASENTTLPTPDPRTSEDCLFLDVIVPTRIFNSKNGTGAAVMVWIYGGGYTAGDKSGINGGSPAGLLAQSQQNGQEGVIYVAMNYRLGLFGWLSGPTFQEDGLANAGLYDQRLALEWVQKNIHLFGGDPNRVTVFGESAGGGSIMHQITAFGGLKGPVPFQQAILQSPGFAPIPENSVQEGYFQETLSTASTLFGTNITTVEQLRTLSTSQLVTLNLVVVGKSSPYGGFTFNPVVDGLFSPALPGILLAHGQFDKSLNIMLGHNSDEGLLFTNPFILTDEEYDENIVAEFPDISNTTADFISSTLYPPVFDGSLGYTTQTERLALTVSEFVFTCNTRYLDLAYNNKTFSYFFNIPPGLHGEDVAYTYFNGDTTTSDDGQPVIAAIAEGFQSYLTSFAMTGNPNTAGLPEFPVYGADAQVLNVNETGFLTGEDTVANDRCTFWQKALYF